MLLTRDDRKISIIGGLLLLGLTLTTGIAVYSAMRQQIESVLGRGLDVALQGKALLIESLIEKGVADTRALTLRPFIIQSMKELNVQPGNDRALHDLARNVNSLTQAGFSAAVIYDMHGNVLSQVGRFSENQSQSLPLNKYSNTSLVWDGQFILRTDQEVLDEDMRRLGSITTEITLPQLTRRFSEIRSIGETGEFILCAPPAPGKQEMPCLISHIDGINFKYLKRVTEVGVLPISYALDGKSGVIAVKDYRQIPVIEAYAPLRTIGLGMILKLDEGELFRPVNEELKIIILYLAGLIIAEILLLNWFVRKLIKSEKEARNAKETAEQFSVELSHKEIELRERLKEITCLYEIRHSTGLGLSVDEVCQQIFEHLIPAMQYPEHASAMIELDGRRITSINQNQDLVHELKSDITVNGKVCGRLSVFYPEDKSFLVLEEQRLIDAITSDLAKWLERKQVDELLRIRLKEITCLYEIRRGMGLELSMDDISQHIFMFLIPAMQFPEIATIVIEVDGKRFTSKNQEHSFANISASKTTINDKVCFECYKKSDAIGFVLQSKISVNGRVCGHLSVFYPEDKPFLVLEEQRLIDTIADDLAKWLERKKVDELLRERLKEITCLYEIRRGIGMESSIDNVCQNIFEHLISAVQFPEIATAVIELDGWRFTSGKYRDHTRLLQSKTKINSRVRNQRRAERDPACTCWSPISVNGKICGQLRVFYPSDKPFLVPEEQKLVNAIASDLESWLERKRLEQALVFVAEEQAHTIGQELHDNLGQQIAAIGYQARALEKQIFSAGSESMAKTAAAIASQAQIAVIQIKQLAQGLLPFELEANGLIPALQTLAARIATTYNITCNFSCNNSITISDNNLALNLYRVAQEAVNNAIRHGKAQHIDIALTSEEGILRLSICDDGSGFVGIDTNHKSISGMGIKIMQYRAKQLGAKLEFLSRSEGGTEVRLEMRMA
ncbi:ATP-binding protein [Nitrosomonas sp. Nm166]|uniref:ATP-binding protein n=1 Tax=Nitrosomonas sp. Nm166 TaxID=1881054 RepID=UPI0008EFB19A|nr:ATP-binding protein [Nitrosomonas sp. Nm166]SFE06689.1 Histidine kinase-, DNA gyrase B-, and HSP90-like ATPase [Nitrosomonas sp. Nm166]